MEPNRDFFVALMAELRGLDFKIQELKGGITNKLYRVRAQDGKDYIFRLYGQKTELFIDRDTEAENLRRMTPSGVAPQLIKYLPEENTTIVELIPGYVLKNPDFLREELWELIIRPIKRIHQSGATLPNIFDPLIEVKRLHKILEDINPDYPEFDLHGTIQVLEKISNLVSLSHSRYLPCHNDLLADNFILSEDRKRFPEPMYLIDWEYAGMAPAYYDMADMFQEILVPREVERKLLMIYWEDEDLDHNQYITNLFKPFPDIYWFLWSLIQLNISTIRFDYYNYGKTKYENAQKNIRHLIDDYNVKI